MKCLICLQSETESGLTSITFERGEFRLVVHHAPAQICSHCGEAYLDEDATIRLLRAAEEIFNEGAREETREYASL